MHISIDFIHISPLVSLVSLFCAGVQFRMPHCTQLSCLLSLFQPGTVFSLSSSFCGLDTFEKCWSGSLWNVPPFVIDVFSWINWGYGFGERMPWSQKCSRHGMSTWYRRGDWRPVIITSSWWGRYLPGLSTVKLPAFPFHTPPSKTDFTCSPCSGQEEGGVTKNLQKHAVTTTVINQYLGEILEAK